MLRCGLSKLTHCYHTFDLSSKPLLCYHNRLVVSIIKISPQLGRFYESYKLTLIEANHGVLKPLMVKLILYILHVAVFYNSSLFASIPLASVRIKPWKNELMILLS